MEKWKFIMTNDQDRKVRKTSDICSIEVYNILINNIMMYDVGCCWDW